MLCTIVSVIVLDYPLMVFIEVLCTIVSVIVIDYPLMAFIEVLCTIVSVIVIDYHLIAFIEVLCTSGLVIGTFKVIIRINQIIVITNPYTNQQASQTYINPPNLVSI